MGFEKVLLRWGVRVRRKKGQVSMEADADASRKNLRR
jgi:hypothetical protein